jgi:hypothetical protein
MTPSLICLVHSRYTSYYTIEVDPNQTKRCKQSPHMRRMDCNLALNVEKNLPLLRMYL